MKFLSVPVACGLKRPGWRYSITNLVLEHLRCFRYEATDNNVTKMVGDIDPRIFVTQMHHYRNLQERDSKARFDGRLFHNPGSLLFTV